MSNSQRDTVYTDIFGERRPPSSDDAQVLPQAQAQAPEQQQQPFRSRLDPAAGQHTTMAQFSQRFQQDGGVVQQQQPHALGSDSGNNGHGGYPYGSNGARQAPRPHQQWQPPAPQGPPQQQHRPPNSYSQQPPLRSQSQTGQQMPPPPPTGQQQQQQQQQQHMGHAPQQHGYQQQRPPPQTRTTSSLPSSSHHVPVPLNLQRQLQRPPQQIPQTPPMHPQGQLQGHRSFSLQGPAEIEPNRIPLPIKTDIPYQQQRYSGGASPTMKQTGARSPIVQQGINLITRNASRNFTSPPLSASATFNGSIPAPPSPNRTMSLNSSFLPFRSASSSDNLAGQASSKHHSNTLTKKTSSGRIIPQKFEMSNGSSGSTMGLGFKSRSLGSMAKGRRVSSSSTNSLSSKRISSQNSLSSRTMINTSGSVRPPRVYPAMLSRVATIFKKIIVLSQHNIGGLEYRDSFTGSEAVDAIAFIIRTTDRNLALLLGRALDAQKFFHDVTYEHRLRDSSSELYQFDEVYVSSPQFDRTSSFASESQQSLQTTLITTTAGSGIGLNDDATQQEPLAPDHLVNGVFTLLTECYSATCTRDSLCYSIACPRRLEQQARLNMKPQGGLKRNESHASLHDEEEKKQLWSHTVPKQLLDSLDKREIKRQELIYEVVATERTFVRNLEYIRDFWIRPLRESNIIPISEREKFIRTVFFNVVDILNVATRFRDALVRRQQLKPVVENIGDIFLEFVPYFEPFISYNAGQCFAKYELERQKAANPLFKRFIEETERLSESNRLNISSYLSQATTRTVRYNLLLKDIIKNSKEESIDVPDLKRASEQILRLLERINVKVGKAEDRHALILLKQRLVFRPGEYVDLKLGADNRKILYTAPLKRKNQDKDNQGDIQVYLLDHVLLFVRVKVINKREQHKVFQRPIPLPLLFVSSSEEMPSLRPFMKKPGAYAHVLSHPSANDTKNPIAFAYVGRRGYDLTLYGTTNSAQESLVSVIESQQNKLRDENDIFTLTSLGERMFDLSNRINCLVPYDGGRKLLYGSDSGVYTSEVIRTKDGKRQVTRPVKVISKVNVTQLEVLEEYQTLLALADKKLYAWPLEILTSQDKKTGKEIMSHVSFFKVGVCSGKMLVVAAKSDLIRVFEPSDPFSKKMSKKKFKNETREFNFSSEPVSISFLKTRLIVGCTKGFEIVSLNDGKIEGILDPADTSLDFITNREGLKPLAIHRISSNFLLSYSDFSFFINKNGWRTRSDWMINWEGIPQSFSLWYPYLLAFEPNFIEIRHVDTGELLRVILGENIRLLHMGSQEILYAYEDERGFDVVASLDFWDKGTKREKLSDIKEVD